MSLLTQVNKIDCGANGTIGAGLAGCRIDWERTVLIGVIKQRGYKFTEEISLEYIRELEQAGIVDILQGVVSFVDQTADDTIITRDGSGLKRVAGKMPYEKVATFDNGVNFQKAITSLSSYDSYDLFFMDVNNNLWFTSTKAGEFKGFTAGMFEAGKYCYARITVNKVSMILGWFPNTPEGRLAASEVYKTAAKKYFGEFYCEL